MNTTNYSFLNTRKSLDVNKYEEKSNLPHEMSGTKLEDALTNWINFISDPKYTEKTNRMPQKVQTHVETYINDYTQFDDAVAVPVDTNTKSICVFRSPMGIDNTIIKKTDKEKNTRIRIRNGNGDSGYLLDDGTVKMNDKVFRLIIRKPDGSYISCQDAIMQAYSQGKRLHFINHRKG